MNRKEREASSIFFNLNCFNAYYLDFNKYIARDVRLEKDMPLLSLFDKYMDNCYYKRFYSKELNKFFMDIKNNVGNKKRIEFSQIYDNKPTTVSLELAMIDRFKGYLFETRTDAKIDELTGLYNADEFQTDINRISRRPVDMDLAVITFDINGLKRKNDEFGHPIGDELIQGAAYCINEVYNICGKCYRTGGDEFTVIAYSSLPELSRRKEYFDYLTSTYKTKNISDISISFGCASIQEHPKSNIFDLRVKSDEALYNDKENYYSKQKTLTNNVQ